MAEYPKNEFVRKNPTCSVAKNVKRWFQQKTVCQQMSCLLFFILGRRHVAYAYENCLLILVKSIFDETLVDSRGRDNASQFFLFMSVSSTPETTYSQQNYGNKKNFLK